jgi:hypothetical protein
MWSPELPSGSWLQSRGAALHLSHAPGGRAGLSRQLPEVRHGAGTSQRHHGGRQHRAGHDDAALVYNSLGVPGAAGVLYPVFGLLLSPMLAAAAMSLSSVSVIANALRLHRARI